MDRFDVKKMFESILKQELTCRRTPLAVVILNKNKYSKGWNGSPTCIKDNECMRKDDPVAGLETLCHPVHAEVRAIAKAANGGIKLQNSTIYMSSWFPCAACAEAIAEAGIVRVVTPTMIYDKDVKLIPEMLGSKLYNFEIAEQILIAKNIEIEIDLDIKPNI
ncbi:hypothetical protein KY308_01280 [Candidatus Woesearchaeota archaeon]|nr:hypothetical protein [Candidatus Woesearchaeota archaeon]